MTKEQIINAYCKIRTIDQTIPDDVLDFMKDSAIEKLESQWISVKNRLPFRTQMVLIYGVGGRMLTSIYHPFTNEDFYCYNMWTEEIEPVEEVTHWIPLPEPPKV